MTFFSNELKDFNERTKKNNNQEVNGGGGQPNHPEHACGGEQDANPRTNSQLRVDC